MLQTIIMAWLVSYPGAIQVETKVYKGEWKNAVSKGPLTVTATFENGAWHMSFDGKSNDDEFSYEGNFTSSLEEGKIVLRGDVAVGPETYTLTCTLIETSFHCEYESPGSGNGNFELKQAE